MGGETKRNPWCNLLTNGDMRSLAFRDGIQMAFRVRWHRLETLYVIFFPSVTAHWRPLASIGLGVSLRSLNRESRIASCLGQSRSIVNRDFRSGSGWHCEPQIAAWSSLGTPSSA